MSPLRGKDWQGYKIPHGSTLLWTAIYTNRCQHCHQKFHQESYSHPDTGALLSTFSQASECVNLNGNRTGSRGAAKTQHGAAMDEVTYSSGVRQSVQLHPYWVIAGGCCLAFMGAAVNAGFLIHLGTSVSHLTGDVSRIAMESVQQRELLSEAVTKLLVAMAGFILGASVAGYFIHHPTLEISRPYGRSVTAIGGLLLLAHLVFQRTPLPAIGLASMACGLQNALATHFRGMVLRSTHLTGLMTDLGSNLGMRLCGHQIPAWKICVPAILVMSFFMGAAFGSMLIMWWHLPFLLLLGSLYVLGGLGWSLAKRILL